jgi:hypothetical protein
MFGDAARRSLLGICRSPAEDGAETCGFHTPGAKMRLGFWPSFWDKGAGSGAGR